ncbi:kinase-like domain-containing protein, partial [Mycena galopus ATCC 62051]
LSEACDKLPSALFITGVVEHHSFPSFHGGFGDIYQASYAGATVALKHMRTFADGGEDQRRIRLVSLHSSCQPDFSLFPNQFCREALVWQRLQHPHILPFIGIDREAFPPSLCMVSPWMEHGTVLKYLSDHGRSNVDKLLSEIAQGLQYLHSQNLVHGDLRGTNILITDGWKACLADFGLSSFSNATASHTNSTHRAGSIRWMAPELIVPERFRKKFARTAASDIFAFGCVCVEASCSRQTTSTHLILFQLYTGRPPFYGVSETTAMFKVIEGDRPDRPSSEPFMSDALWAEVTECWAQDSEMRPTSEIVLSHIQDHLND